MAYIEVPDAVFVRDHMSVYTDRLLKTYNMLQRLINNITIQSEWAKALRVHIWGGTIDTVSTVSTVSSYAGMTGEGASDRYFLVKHVLQPLLTDARSLRFATSTPGSGLPPKVLVVAGFDGSAVRSLLTDSSGRLVVANPPALDVNLSTLARLVRWGRDVSPVWVHSGEVTAPSAGSALVSRAVSQGRVGFIYGFYLMASEPNDFRINWTSGGTAYSVRIPLAGGGAVHYVDTTPLNEGAPADGGSTVSVTVVATGSTGSVYQARLLYVEV